MLKQLSLMVLVSLFGNLNCEDKNFVVLIPSYNNMRWYKDNLDSVFKQTYSNYRIVYIDACSPDGTGNAVESYIKQIGKTITLIKSSMRKYPVENIYDGIHRYCGDHEVVVILDGDDQFAHPDVLKKLNEYYQNKNIWLTCGNYKDQSNGVKCPWAKRYSNDIVKNNAFRKHDRVAPHLRSFYGALFKKVDKSFLVDKDGKFYSMAGDVAYMSAMLELAGDRHMFIDEVLYIRNNFNPINEHRVNEGLQLKTHDDIAKKTPCKKLKGSLW